jgi:3-hydroxybutyryl-CoA dehydrogenase
MSSTGATLVVGGGTMGVGIVQVLLEAGATIDLVEPSDTVKAKVLERLGDRDGLTIHDSLDGSFDVELAVEAVPEDIGLKQEVLASIEAAVPESCVVASNTSSLSIDAIASTLSRPAQFIGMHFFNPVPKSLLVELVIGVETADDTVATAKAWVERIGKEQISVKDSPGFATSRLGLAIGLEAMRMVQDGVASAEDIDKGMVLGYKFPTGPLKLTDLIGLDVRLAIAEHLAEELGPRFEPPQLLRDKVAAGELGKKSGKGFYEWS